MPEKKESNGVVKTMEICICFLCRNIFPYFSKSTHHKRCEDTHLVYKFQYNLKCTTYKSKETNKPK